MNTSNAAAKQIGLGSYARRDGKWVVRIEMDQVGIAMPCACRIRKRDGAVETVRTTYIVHTEEVNGARIVFWEFSKSIVEYDDCDKCGKKVERGITLCPHCGHSL